jgi:hypothetical protein
MREKEIRGEEEAMKKKEKEKEKEKFKRTKRLLNKIYPFRAVTQGILSRQGSHYTSIQSFDL